MMRLSSDDIGLWRRAMRDVIPLRGRVVFPDRNDDPPDAPPLPDRGHPARLTIDAGETRAVRAKLPPQQRHQPPLDHFAGLDRTSAERLRRGRNPFEARLDLHGMTQAEAHRALTGFVAGSRAIGRRVVLVITGYGSMSGGVLKAAVPRWLNEPELRRHVLAIAGAQKRDGGAGALYVLLRKAA
jgi:DNA-nicking Smr family endonuclease